MGDDNGSENPWESASNDQAFREQAAAQAQGGRAEPSTPSGTSVRWDIDEDNHNRNNANVSLLTSETITESNGRRRGVRTFCANCLSKCSTRYFLHVWDISLTSFWVAILAYHLYVNRNNEHSRSTSMAILLILSIVLAILNASRWILRIWASLPSLSTMCCCGCCFVDDDSDGIFTTPNLARTLTLWLGIVYGGIAIAEWFGPSSWLPWCDGFGGWCSKLIPTEIVMPIAITVASVIELTRWIFLNGQLSSSSPALGARTRSPDYYNDDASTPSGSSRHRPWWISRYGSNQNNGLSDPLLDSSQTRNGQPSWTTTSWMPFRTRSNTNGTNNIISGDEEDVGSVLDSLGEDWASRAESDPYWWTRSEGQQ